MVGLRPPDWAYRADGFVVRTVDPDADTIRMQALTELMERVWADDDQALGERNLIPPHVFDGQAKRGNLLVVNPEGSDDVVGFVTFMPPVTRPGEDAWVYSNAVGIDPAWKNRGVGTIAKRAQAGYLVDVGYRGMIWTFDPNQSRNARLNFHKLGCVSTAFKPNQYPELPGLPADRLVPTLDFHSARYQQTVEFGTRKEQTYEAVEHVFVLDPEHRVAFDASIVRRAGPNEFEVGDVPERATLLVDNPWDFNDLREDDQPSAVQTEIHFGRRALFDRVLETSAGDGTHAVVDYLTSTEVAELTGIATEHPGYVLVPRRQVADVGHP